MELQPNTTREWHGLPMLRVFKAIKYLQAHKLPTTAPAIGELLGRTTAQVLSRLSDMRDYRLIRRRVIGLQMKKKEKKNKKGCFWVHEITAKGAGRYKRLLTRFGDCVTLNVPEPAEGCCETPTIPEAPQKPALPALSPDPLSRMKELDQMLHRK